MTDIIVVGAGCAGLSAAIYAARAGKSVMVLESENTGGQITAAPCVENYPGVASISGLAFADMLCEQALALGAQLDLAHVTGLRPGSPCTVETEDGPRTCKAVILATGSRHKKLHLPREEALCGHGVSYCAVCDGAFFAGAEVAVVGGGSAALQSAAFLAERCSSVTLIHRREVFRGEEALAARVCALPNCKLALGCTVQALLGENALSGVILREESTGKSRTLPVKGLFLAIGQQPANEAFSSCVALDPAGYIVADERCVTNVPGVFAAGDCRTKAVRQLTTAAADGAVAALGAAAWASAH